MDEFLQQARSATIHEFERLLRRGMGRGDAVDEALDLHYDRVSRLRIDADQEMDDMKAILAEHRPGPVSPPAAQRQTPARPGQGQSGRPRPAPVKRSREPVDETLLKSPYRFVELNDRVVDADRVDLDTPLPGGWCGSITVEWAAETPILIGVGEKDAQATDDPVKPMRHGRGQDDKATIETVKPMRWGATGPYVIPGATIRGCLRAALEIVTSSRLTQVNAHARFGLRDFDHPSVRPADESEPFLLAPGNVKAGWLVHKGGDLLDPDEAGLEIQPCKDWHLIAIADLPAEAEARKRGDHRTQYQWREAWLKTELPERYRQHDRAAVSEGVIDFDKVATRRFARVPTRPGTKQVLRPDPRGDIEGRLVFSNRSPAAPNAAMIESKERQGGPGQPKKREYVFVDDPHAEPVTVGKEVWRHFLAINSKVFKNKLKPDGSWARLYPSLKEDGARIPVFYVIDKKRQLQIGLTRFFKILHEESVEAMRDRSKEHAREKAETADKIPLDMAESLFGHVWEPSDVLKDPDGPTPPSGLARKGRVACGFATAPADSARESTPVVTVMGAPRASFAPFYLRGRYKDWSAPADSDTRLAGRKRYLPRHLGGNEGKSVYALLEKQVTRLERDNRGKVPDTIKTKLVFLEPAQSNRELRFTGDIRLHNLSEVEVGALLWVLTHGGDPAKHCRHMIGRAKPFGAGQMRVHRLFLALTPNDGKQERTEPRPWELAQENTGWLEPGSWSMEPFLQAFHEHMQAKRPGWPFTRDMMEYLAACDPRLGSRLDAQKRLDYPDDLKDFNKIRQSCKRSTRQGPPDDRHTRFLPVLEDGDAERWRSLVRLPYPTTSS